MHERSLLVWKSNCSVRRTILTTARLLFATVGSVGDRRSRRQDTADAPQRTMGFPHLADCR